MMQRQVELQPERSNSGMRQDAFFFRWACVFSMKNFEWEPAMGRYSGFFGGFRETWVLWVGDFLDVWEGAVVILECFSFFLLRIFFHFPKEK